MSRRFWLGTPKGQNTTADTFFNTLRETIYLVQTSAPTTFDTTFLTTYPTSTLTLTTYPTSYLTYYNTSDIVNTQFFLITQFLTPYVTDRITSRDTDYIVGTAYTTTFLTQMPPQNTTTSYVTNYTYPVPTTYPTQYPVFATTTYETSRPTTAIVPVFRSTTYSNFTTYPGGTIPTFYMTSNPTSSIEVFSGCFYYGINGNVIGSDPLPPGNCVESGPCTGVDSFSTAQAYTYYLTSRATTGTTTFLTYVYIGQITSNPTTFAGLTDPTNGFFDCYDSSEAFDYCYNFDEAFPPDPMPNCEPCTGTRVTSFETDVGYDTYTTGPLTYDTFFETSNLTTVTYLSSRCFPNCQFTCSGITSYQTFRPTFYPPYAVVTSFQVNTFVRNTTYSYITYFNTSNEYFTGSFTPVNTTRITQYPTSNVTSKLTATSIFVNTTDTYNVPTTYIVSTSFTTSFPTNYLTSNPTQYITNIPTTFQTSNITSNLTSNLTTTTFDTSNLTTASTTRITEWLTEYPQNTEVLTSRSTTWFTQ